MLITISRQYASGGTQVAKLVADRLGWQLVGNALIDEVARRAGIPPEEVQAREDRPPSFVERLARVASAQLPDLFLPAPPIGQPIGEGNLVRVTRSVVCEIAAQGHCVFVGRASAAVLAWREDALHARLVAGAEFRRRVAVEVMGVPEKDAVTVVERRDANRIRYHREYYARDCDDPRHYDLVLNTERLGFPGAADQIVHRARVLGWAD
ncbi:MAG: cytidylate kinase-like family protein [Acidobacteriota bacterium]|nr:cytidylate kinase-like family protein [Acidobacteriota bacterium]MDE3264289.1 cytidylate kinase-like family protein [Acidobacteriota bacterium]